MQIQNFQQIAWNDLFTNVVDRLAIEASQDYVVKNSCIPALKITYSVPQATKDLFLNGSTQQEDDFLPFTVEVTVKYNQICKKMETTLIELPRLIGGGITINGCRRTPISVTNPACGWYLEPINKKPGVFKLTLHRGAGVVLSVAPERMPAKKTAFDYNYVVTIFRRKQKFTMSLADFLIALSGNATVTRKDIADYCNLTDCKLFTETFASYSSATVEDVCIAALRRLYNRPQEYKPEQPITKFAELFTKNLLNIGRGRIPRFGKFTSFFRAINCVLNEDIYIKTDKNGVKYAVKPEADTFETRGKFMTPTYARTTAITEAIARDLDSVKNLTELNIIKETAEGNMEFCLTKIPNIDEGISLEEVCCALRVYDQLFRGLGAVDDVDDTCNKTLHSVREDFTGYIEDAFNKFNSAILSAIRAENHNDNQLVDQIITNLYSKTVNAETIAKRISDSAFYQLTDETNSLSAFDQSYRVTSTASNVTNKARDIHATQYGRICPYTTSESKQVGLNLDITLGCGIDKYGFCTTPAYKVDVSRPAAERIGELVQLSAVDDYATVVAPAGADLTGDLSDVIANCRVNGKFENRSLSDVTHIMKDKLQTIGPLIASVPSQNRDAGKRSVMSVSAQRQALIPWKVERPFVTTGLDSICDIGIQRAKDLMLNFIFSNARAYKLYQANGENLPEILEVLNSRTDENSEQITIDFRMSLSNILFTFSVKQKLPAATIKGSLKYTRFNIPRKTGQMRFFNADDIVFYNNDIVLSDVEINLPEGRGIDFGDTVAPADANARIQELSSHGVGIGANVNVMFKSMNGYTYEDSIVVNEDFLARQGLAIVRTHTISFTIPKDRVIADDCNDVPTISNGLPRTGVYLRAGQAVLAVKSTSPNTQNNVIYYTVPVGTQGYVMSCDTVIKSNSKSRTKSKSRKGSGSCVEQEVRVHLGDILPVGVGDKLTGLHGNKGVIGRIMKSSEMPFTADGTVADVILNPLGILARLNIGQEFEFTLGAISRKTGKIEVLEPFSSAADIHDLMKRAEDLGLVEQDVYSGTTGVKLDKKALVGNMYFLRVEHTSTSKYNATGDCKHNISNRTNQPVRCAGGAQRVSEMGTWCLLSMNASDLLESLFSVQSDSPRKADFDNALANGNRTNNIPITSSNFELTRAYFYMLGVNFDIHSSENSDQPDVSLRFLTDADIDSRAYDENSGNIKTVRLVDTASIALHDVSLFGTAETSAGSLPKSYAKLPFNAEIIMPTVLHTNEVPKLIYAKILKSNEDIEYRTLSRNIVNELIDCDSSHKGFELIGWEHWGTLNRNQQDVQDILAKLSDCGISIPSDFSDIYIPVLRQVVFEGALEYPEESTEFIPIEKHHVGISAVIEIFKNYSLFSSIFFNSIKTSTQASSGDEVEEVDDNAESMDDNIEEEVAVLEDSEGLVKIEHDESEITAEDDTDIQEYCGDTAEEETLAEDIDNAAIEKKIPSFRALVMLIRNYHTEYGNVLANFIVTGMLIPPNKYRPIVADDSSRNNPIDICLNAIYDQVKSGTTTDKQINDLYKKLRHCILTGSNKKAPSIVDQIKDHKSGMSLLRDTNLSKRVSYSARSVISIGRDLQFGECGIPVCMLTTIFMNQLIRIYSGGTHISDNLRNKGVTVNAFQSNGIDIHIVRDVNKALVCLSNRNYAGFREISGAQHVTPARFDILYHGLVDNLTLLLEEQPCILNREPSLHMFSTQGFKVKPIDYYTIQLHPLNCHGFNADFDGDQMAAIFPMHEKGRADTINNVMARKHLIDPKDCSGIISLNQDMILGLYYATIHKNNVADTANYYLHFTLGDVKKFYTLPKHTEFTKPYGHSFGVAEPIMSDVLAGIIKLHDLVYCQYDNRAYLAEAGKFIVNAILPGGIGFTTTKLNNPSGGSDTIVANVQLYKLFVDRTITKKTINPITDACKQYFINYDLDVDDSGDHLADVYNRLMNLGFIAADISGISLSLKDFAELPVKSLIASQITNTEQGVALSDTWFDLGFCTEQEHDNVTSGDWVNTITKCKDEIKTQFELAGTSSQYTAFARNSNIYMIIDSGARGDVNQLLEMSGMIGVVYNAANEQIKNPILSSYMDGLSPMDFASNAYTARRQISAAQLTTADSGAVTRDLIYLAEHLHIRNDNECCNTFVDNHKMLSIPCMYTATTADDREIEWLLGNGQALGEIEIVTDENILDTLFNHFVETNDGEDLFMKLIQIYGDRQVFSFISDCLCYVTHKTTETPDTNTYCTYLRFIHCLNTKNEVITNIADQEAIAGSCHQQYAYVIKVDNEGKMLAFGMRPYHLKLSKLSRDMLKWRITNIDAIPNSPLTKYNNNARYLQPDDFAEDESILDEVLLETDVIIDDDILETIENNALAEIPIYSMLTCTSSAGICRKCFGVAYDTFKLPRPGTLIGYNGIQSIANPMSQLILDSHKSEYSNDESAMSKIKRTTSCRHEPVTRTGKDVLKLISKDEQNLSDTDIHTIPFAGFVAGECGVITIDDFNKGKCNVTVFERYSTEKETLLVKSSKFINISQLRVSPMFISDPDTGTVRVLSATDEEYIKNILNDMQDSEVMPTGTIVADFDDYGTFMGCGDQTDEDQCLDRANKARFAYWEALCKCFTKDTILSRNFEVFARALTEFGIARVTDIENNIIAGYTYAIPKLIEAGVTYQPVIEKSASARTLADKLMTDIAHSNPIAKINMHIANGTVQTKSTHLGNQVLGNSGQIITRLEDTHKLPVVNKPKYISSQTSAPVYGKLSISPNSSEFDDCLYVSMEYTGTEPVVIYYTVDGHEPSTVSQPYSTPLIIHDTTTVKAIAIGSTVVSPIVVETFTKKEKATSEPLVEETEVKAATVSNMDSAQTQAETTSMF